MERRYGVGYALAPKKQASFIRVSLIELARKHGIDLIKIDLSKPLIEQGPFDCVLHKIYGSDWENQLLHYSSIFPNSLIIDSPDSIKRLHNRVSMLQVVSELIIDCPEGEGEGEGDGDGEGEGSFGVPKQFVIDECSELGDVDGRIAKEGLKFPVIAKPLVADGSAKSHKMSLVYNNVGLNELKVKPPIVLQEFVNHGGVIFKVYVVGGYVKCVKRKSLADINEEKLGSLEGAVSFSQVSNVSSSEKTGHEEYDRLMMDLEEIELPPLSLITDIAIGLKKATKLHLFNFDVIRDTKVGNRYLVIDINYFPGYAKMPDYERVLTDFFWDVLSKDNNGVGSFKKPESRDKGVRLLVNTGCNEDDGMVLPVSPLKREEKEASIQV